MSRALLNAVFLAAGAGHYMGLDVPIRGRVLLGLPSGLTWIVKWRTQAQVMRAMRAHNAGLPTDTRGWVTPPVEAYRPSPIAGQWMYKHAVLLVTAVWRAL
jgi:hypothetical protein